MIIDGNALIHRSFHAIPPTLRTKDGVLINAVYGFTSFLLKALNEFHPEFVVLTLDKSGPTFRHIEYTEYKATRVKAPDELYEQIPYVKRVAEAFSIPIFELSGFEADDLIGTICKQTNIEKNLEKIIITGDMDTLQLIDEKNKVYTMSRGLSDSVIYDDLKVKERYGLVPAQIIDYKALRGDPGDNIPGVRGIGEKTAVELLNEFENLENLYQAVKKDDKKIRPRILELLKESEANAFLSQKLATIDQDAPIKFKLNDAVFSSFKLEKVINLFSELEFRSLLEKVKILRDKLDKTHKNSSIEDETKPKENRFERSRKEFAYKLIDSDKEFLSFLKLLKSQKSFALKTAISSPDLMTAKLYGIGFSFKDGEAYFILINDKKLKDLKEILENNKVKKFGHNLKADWRILNNYKINLSGLDFDIMIASYLLNPGERQNSLDSLAFSELGFEKISQKDVNLIQGEQLSLDFKEFNPEKLSLSVCEDVDFSRRLVKILNKKLEKENLVELFNKIEIPLIPILGQMENNGIKINRAPLEKLSKEVEKKLATLEKEIHKLAKEDFNINSTKQLKEILFEKLKISTDNIKKTKTGFSTAEDELIKLQEAHPIIPLLQEYRELNKLFSTYLNALPKMINPKTGKIHTNFNQTVTATGRLSSTEPNLQNIPARTEEGKKIRTAFIADSGYKLIGFDYSQIELRLAAHMSGDKKMIEAFKNNEDIHRATAAEINNISLGEVTSKLRSEAKATNFGILYGQGAHGLSQNAGIPYWQASEFIKKYFGVYPSVKKMIDSSIKCAKESGYAVTLFGRKRNLPEINSNIPMLKKSAERMAINTPLQGTAADLIKMAMIKVGELIAGKEAEIRMILQIHDELIFEVKNDKVESYQKQIKEIMQEVIKLKVPITVDENTGNNWGELK